MTEFAKADFRRTRRRGSRDRVAEALLALGGERAVLVGHRESPWASITFAGSRHRAELLFEGAEAVEDGEHFIVIFPDHDLDLPGQLVVDAAITVVEHRLEPARLRVSVEIMLVEQG